MRRAKYVCIEGVDGVGKTTQTDLICSKLRSLGYKVFQTKEPGTPHSPVTMELRNIMLDMKYDKELTTTARELISQAIRSIHLEKVVKPALVEYDFVIQDRGLLSGLAYGEACGNKDSLLAFLMIYNLKTCGIAPSKLSKRRKELNDPFDLYDVVFHLVGNVEEDLIRAKKCKSEFGEGDAIENKGLEFMKRVEENMGNQGVIFPTKHIHVSGRSRESICDEMRTFITRPNWEL